MPIDAYVYDYLKRNTDMPSTGREIAEATGLSISSVNTCLLRMEAAGTVRKMGDADRGARTWAVA